MRDRYADTFTDKVCKLLPAGLVKQFGAAAGTFYALPGLKTTRYCWWGKNVMSLNSDEQPPMLSLLSSYDTYRQDGVIKYVPKLKLPEICGDLDSECDEQFLDSITYAQTLLPDFIKRLIAERGDAFKVARTLNDIDPECQYIRARGQTGYLENTAGFFNPSKRFIAASQGFLSPEDRSYKSLADIQPLYSWAHTVLHEYGHVIEDMLFNTNSPRYDHERIIAPYQRDFFRAYREDAAALEGRTTHRERKLTYFLEQKFGGSQETEEAACSELFAELFSERYLDYHVTMAQAFPRAKIVFDKIMFSLEVMISRAPDYGDIYVIPEYSNTNLVNITGSQPHSAPRR